MLVHSAATRQRFVKGLLRVTLVVLRNGRAARVGACTYGTGSCIMRLPKIETRDQIRARSLAVDSCGVSIIIVNMNSESWLRKCLESINDIQGSLPLQIIVVDNGSTDGSLATARGLRRTWYCCRNPETWGTCARTTSGSRKPGSATCCS